MKALPPEDKETFMAGVVHVAAVLTTEWDDTDAESGVKMAIDEVADERMPYTDKKYERTRVVTNLRNNHDQLVAATRRMLERLPVARDIDESCFIDQHSDLRELPGAQS